jgi:hypothetical protein
MGVEPGVTQSAETIADDKIMNIVAPFMKYWIIGTLHKDSIDQRRAQNLIKPEHRLITYHSSANHWQPYSNTRGHCGFNPAYFDLDACWIQTYYRWNQSEAIIYPGDKGPTSSAAWEGARDGLDDGNYLRLARVMTEALQSPEVREQYRARIEEIVGTNETSLIRFQDKMGGSGMVTSMVGYNTADFCKAKTLLLQLITELADIVPVQKASADFGLHHLICNGVVQFDILREMTFAAKAKQFITESAGALEFDQINMVSVEDRLSNPILFMGTFQELKKILPELSEHSDLSDISQQYPCAGNYVVRFVRHQLEPKSKERLEDQPESMLIICGDEDGADKALSLLGNVVTQPRSQYSHWLINHSH